MVTQMARINTDMGIARNEAVTCNYAQKIRVIRCLEV